MPDNDLDTMPKRTKYARKEAGYKSQASIAQGMGITREAYAWYETTADMPTDKLALFRDLTGFNTDWLLTGSGPMKKDRDDWTQKHVSRLEELNDVERDAYDRQTEAFWNLIDIARKK